MINWGTKVAMFIQYVTFVYIRIVKSQKHHIHKVLTSSGLDSPIDMA
jgi:hypothetical protein